MTAPTSLAPSLPIGWRLNLSCSSAGAQRGRGSYPCDLTHGLRPTPFTGPSTCYRASVVKHPTIGVCVLGLVGCSRTTVVSGAPAAADIAGALELAGSEFAAELARAPWPTLPAGVALEVACCGQTSLIGAPVSATIVARLPPAPGRRPDERPTLTLTGWSISSGTPRILRRPDFAEMRTRAPLAVERATAVMGIADEALVAVDRASPHRVGGFRAISLLEMGDGRWEVYYLTEDETTYSINIGVDLVAGAAVHAFRGARREPVALPR